MTTLLRIPLLAAVALAAACGGPRAASPEPSATAPGTSASASPVSPVSDFSVYDLETAWTDQAGRARTLGSLAGRPQVVAMVYTRCAHTCPAIIAEFKRLEATAPAGAETTGFVLVSLDPARDTPARLAEFAESARLDPARWTLLTGDEDGVREMAAVLGIRYRLEEGGEVSHANAYRVLDADGRIVHRQEVLGQPESARAALAGLDAAVAAAPAER